MRSPNDAREILRRLEWEHATHFRDLLLGARSPGRIALQPPTGTEAASDPVAVRQFREAWELEQCAMADSGSGEAIRFEDRSYRVLGQQRLPIDLSLVSIDAVAQFLGPPAVHRLGVVRDRLRPFQDHSPELGAAATRFVARLEAMSAANAQMLAVAIRQLRCGLGRGSFLRSLPLDGVHTKFLEENSGTVYLIVNAWTKGEVEQAGGLEAWLECLSKGEDRILVRPLCANTRAAFAGASKLWVTSDDLASMQLPGTHLLIVENETSGLALSDLSNTVAVAGAGGNLAWLEELDVSGKVLGYWGDIDSWGLRLLSIARGYRPSLTALMMDEATLDRHPGGIVVEDTVDRSSPANLRDGEIRLLSRLLSHTVGPARLEQEKLGGDWILQHINAWRWAGQPTESGPASFS